MCDILWSDPAEDFGQEKTALLAATGLASPVNILQKAQPVKVRAADGFQNTVYFTNW